MLLADPATLHGRTRRSVPATAGASTFGINFGAASAGPDDNGVPAVQSRKPRRTRPGPHHGRRRNRAWIWSASATSAPQPGRRAGTAVRAAAGWWDRHWIDRDPTTTARRRIVTARLRRSAGGHGAPRLNYLAWAKPFVDKSNFATSIAKQTRETALTTPIFLRGVHAVHRRVRGGLSTTRATPRTPRATRNDRLRATTRRPEQQIRWYGCRATRTATPGIDCTPTRAAGVARRRSGTDRADVSAARFQRAAARAADRQQDRPVHLRLGSRPCAAPPVAARSLATPAARRSRQRPPVADPHHDRN